MQNSTNEEYFFLKKEEEKLGQISKFHILFSNFLILSMFQILKFKQLKLNS